MTSFDFVWPWAGVAVALTLLGLLLFTRLFCISGSGSRWNDPAWLAVLGLPLYMIHQFEEHGIDALGAPYAFRGWLCLGMNFPDALTCPIPLSFITAVNVGSVWGASVFASVFRRRSLLMALSAYGIPFVNALSHIGSALRQQAYNPGLLTAAVLFLPLSLWALRAGKHNGLDWLDLAAITLGGVLVHAILLGSLIAFLHHLISSTALALIQIFNMAVPATAALTRQRLRRHECRS